MGGSAFGLHRRKRIAFYGKFGAVNKVEKWNGRMRVWTAQA